MSTPKAKKPAPEGVPLPLAAARTGLSWKQAYDAVLRGDLRAIQDSRGRWMCDPASVAAHAERLAKRSQLSRGWETR
jgi:hypothetical protein